MAEPYIRRLRSTGSPQTNAQFYNGECSSWWRSQGKSTFVLQLWEGADSSKDLLTRDQHLHDELYEEAIGLKDVVLTEVWLYANRNCFKTDISEEATLRLGANNEWWLQSSGRFHEPSRLQLVIQIYLSGF